MLRRYYHSLRGDMVLQYLSSLSTQSSNSRFYLRIEQALVMAYIMRSRKKYDWSILDRTLDYGIPQLEDPQEVLFVETVNAPLGSYRVFSSFFLTHKYNLSQLLFLAQQQRIAADKISIVYALLEISDKIANRHKYPRNLCGEPHAEAITFLNYKDFGECCQNNCFGKNDLTLILEKYRLQEEALNDFILTAKSNILKKELADIGHSDTFELHPFLKLDNGRYLVLFPSNLLRLAYRLCYAILQKILGVENLLALIEEEMVQDAGFLLQNANASFEARKSFNDVPFLWFNFDKDKIANVCIVLADKKPSIESALKNSEQSLNATHPEKTIFTFLVTQQLKEDSFSLTSGRPITYFSLEDMKIVMHQDRMNLLNLYYYDLDKSSMQFVPGSQEIDMFAYYISNKSTFYQDSMPDMMFTEIGSALSLRNVYLNDLDEHVVYYAPQNGNVMVRHYADIPKQVSIYSPYMMVPGLYMLQLKHNELWVHLNCTDQYRTLCREATIAIMNWIWALQSVCHLYPIQKNVHIELVTIPGNSYQWEKANNDVVVFCIPEDIITDDASSMELMMICSLLQSLVESGFAESKSIIETFRQLILKSPGRFLLIGDASTTNIIDYNDGITDCYYVNSRYCDAILSEIADHLNIKGNDQVYDFSESKNIMIRVSDFILAEIQKILAEIDTAILLKSLLQLHHAMVFWSKLTQRRYDSLSKAYAYIGASFDNQFEYLNDYSEMNTLSQGLIEAIILNGIHNKGGTIGLEQIDRLFALMHFNLNMGTYMDELGQQVPGSQLTILANGRLAMPRMVINRLNSYFERLRKISMNKPDLYSKLSSLIPQTTLNTKDTLFTDAHIAEFGITFDQYCKIIGASINYATELKEPITIMPETDFIKKVCDGIFDTGEYKIFKEHFILQESLQKEDLKHSDKWLQRFNRPIQITARPWILYEGDIYFSTKTLYESWMIRIERLNNATIVDTSKEMQSFVANVNNKKGHDFTANIRKYYEGLSYENIHIDSEVEVRNGKPLNADRNLGDIDILLINKNSKQIVCIEAKNFVESRTVYELLQQNRKIETKELPHVLDRNKWCKENIDKFKFYVSEVDEQYSVKTIFLTYHENAYNYFQHQEQNDITFLSAIDIVQNPLIVFS